MGSRATSAGLANPLAPEFNVYAYDRWGRGDSTDTKPYPVQREVEDSEALIESAGEAVRVNGISSGGASALESVARLPGKVNKMAIYKVPYHSSGPAKSAWRAGCSNQSRTVPGDISGPRGAYPKDGGGAAGRTRRWTTPLPLWAGTKRRSGQPASAESSPRRKPSAKAWKRW